MINNKFISLKSVMDDVLRDTGISMELNYSDVSYWAYEVLGLMNQPLQFVRKVTGHLSNPNLDVTNYKALIPCDVYKIERIAVNGGPARYANSNFHHLMGGECCDASSGVTSADLFIDNFGNAFTPQSSQLTNSSSGEITFDVNDNYITLSTETGTICLAYLAFPTDAEGYPMIPDDINYKVAVKKYIVMKLRYLDWASDPTNSGKRALFEYDESEYMWYVGKATNAAKMPDIHQMQSIMNSVVNPIPNLGHYDNFFNSLGSKGLKKIY